MKESSRRISVIVSLKYGPSKTQKSDWGNRMLCRNQSFEFSWLELSATGMKPCFSADLSKATGRLSVGSIMLWGLFFRCWDRDTGRGWTNMEFEQNFHEKLFQKTWIPKITVRHDCAHAAKTTGETTWKIHECECPQVCVSISGEATLTQLLHLNST